MMNRRLEIVDFLKGFSIFTIVAMHLMQGYTGGILNKAFSFGGAGVHVFILCSGFGLYLSYLRNPLSYGKFLRRRFLKIYVPYIIVVMASAIVPFYNTSPEKWHQFLGHIFLYKMFVPDYMESYGVQFWFVSTIIQFYLCWPLIVWFFEKGLNKNKCLPIVGGLAISLGWATVVALLHKEDVRIWGSFFLQYMWEFVLGMYIAKRYNDNATFVKIPSYKTLTIVAIVCMAFTGYAGIKGGILKLYNDVPSMLGYLSLAVILYKMFFANRFFIFTNKFSYEWFLTHILVFGCVNHAMKSVAFTPPPHTQVTIYLSVSFALSYIIAYLYGRILKRLRLK